jgi:transposase
MTAQEIIRIQHIEHYCVHACSFTELTESLQVSIRHTRRLIAQFRRDGPQSLVHGLRGRPSNHRLKEDHRNHVKEIIQSKYSTFKPTFVKEKLEEQEGIILSDETVRKIMTDMNLWKPILRSEQRIFQLRERKEAHGMMIQFDGSYHVWLPDVLPLVKWCLLVAIDDATSQITKAEFCDDEGIDDVFPFWHTYVSEL